MSYAVALLATLVQAPALPQASSARVDSTGHSAFAVNVGVFGAGLSLGNSPRWNGVRVNFRDAALRRVNGLSLTVWKAKWGANRESVVTGLAAGLVGPEAGRLRGLTIGGVGVFAHRDMIGLNVGAGALVSEGSIRGVNVAGLGAVSLGKTVGLTVAGLGVVARGGIAGVTIAPIGIVSRGEVVGVSAAGIGLLADGSLKGINLGGLGIVARGKLAGLNLASLAVVGRAQILGLTAAAATVSGRGRVGGITIAGLVVSSGEAVEGISIAGLQVTAPTLIGFSGAPFHRIRGEQRGLVIGLVNSAKALHGFQIGVLNHAGNNPRGLRWLPGINFHP